MSNVVHYPGISKEEIEPDAILECAKGELEDVVVLGWHKEGCLWIAGSMCKSSEILWLMERCKQSLLDV